MSNHHIPPEGPLPSLVPQAHALKPVVLVGAEGLTPCRPGSVLEAFNNPGAPEGEGAGRAPGGCPHQRPRHTVEAIPRGAGPQVIGRTRGPLSPPFEDPSWTFPAESPRGRWTRPGPL